MKTTFVISSLLAFLLPLVSAHARIQFPEPLGYNTTPQLSGNAYNAPLKADGSDFPCKGLIGVADMTPRAKWTAGSKAYFKIQPHDDPNGGEGNLAAHSGGSCQVSLSYDHGNTFKVLHSYIGGCPRDTPLNSNIAGPNQTFTFDIPAEAKAGDAIVAWSWIARTGNRNEYYMNCASVEIDGDGTSTLDHLPDMWLGEMVIGDIHEGMCASVAGFNFDYPNPGEFKTIANEDGSQPVGPEGPGPYGDFSICKSPNSKAGSPAPEEPETPTTPTPDAPEETEAPTPDAPEETETPTPRPTIEVSLDGVTYTCQQKYEL